jgi:hypothetical protein
MNERVRALVAVTALVGAAACGHSEKSVVDQYFGAINQGDTQTVQSFAAVLFDKKVDRWEIKKTLDETKVPAPLPALIADANAKEKAVADNKKTAQFYSNDHFADVQSVKDALSRNAPVPAKLQDVAKQWKEFGDKDREGKRAAAIAKDQVEKERRNVARSAGQSDDIDGMTGDMVTKRLLLSLTIAGQPQDYVMTLRKYDLKNAAGGKVNSRWVIQALAPGSN